MPARTRIAALLAPLALLASCDASPRAEAAVAHPSASAATGAAPRALRSTGDAKRLSASTGKLAPADCDPAKDAASAGPASSSADPMARLRDVMAGRGRGSLAGATPIRCDPNEKKPAPARPAGT